MTQIGSSVWFRVSGLFALHKNYFNKLKHFRSGIVTLVIFVRICKYLDSLLLSCRLLTHGYLFGQLSLWKSSLRANSKNNISAVKKSTSRLTQLTIEDMYCNCSWGHVRQGARVVTGVLLIGVCDVQTAHRSTRLNVRLYAAKEGKNTFITS